MPRAWPSSARPWRRRSSTLWSFSASSASSAVCATRWPVSLKLSASLPSKKSGGLPPWRRIKSGMGMAGLLLSKNFRVGGPGGGGRSDDVERGLESDGHRGQAEFGAAGLVAELERNVLHAERGIGKRGDGQAKNQGALVDVQWRFGKREFLELAFGIGDLAAVETGGKFGLEIGGDEIVFRFFAGIDMEARANLHDHGDFQCPAAGRGIERDVGFGFDDIAAGGDLRQQRGRQDQQADRKDSCFDFHKVTWAPSCWEMTRLMTAWRSSPVFSCTNALRGSFHPSLKLLESAEIQISRTGVLGEITNLASTGSSNSTSSFPDSPSTSKPCSSPAVSMRRLRSSNAASAFR